MASSEGKLDDANLEGSSESRMRRLTSYLRLLLYAEPTLYDILLLLGGVIAAIASGVSFPLLGVLFGQVVDDLNSATCDAGFGDGAAYQADVNDKVLKVVYVGVAYLILAYVSIVCWSLTGERLAQRIRQKYFRSLLDQDVAFFDDLSAGAVSSRLNGDIATIQNGTSEKVGLVLNSISFFVTGYIVAFIKDAKLGGMLVSLLPAFLLMSLVGSHFIQKYTGAMFENVASSTSVALESLSNIMVVHSLTANSRLESKFSSSLGLAKAAGIKKAIAAAIQAGLLYFIAYSANALAYWQGSIKIADAVSVGGSGATVGSTYTVIFILVDASLILSTMAPFFQFFDSASVAFQKLEKDIQRKPTINSTEATGESLQDFSGHLEIKDVSFTYASRLDKVVLQNISIDCPAGKQTALVGLSGSGKSTVASLMMRFYDPNSGSVLVDGRDIRNVDVKSLRGHISLVQQEPSLLERSILENIALGLVNSPAHSHLKLTLQSGKLSDVAATVRLGEDLDQAAETYGAEVIEIVRLVKHAADLADVGTFVSRLKDGYGTLVGSSGSLVSGGQKQRISLARALIKDPKVLILDEATASLDSASEQRVQAALEKAALGRTLVTIAHRLSTIRNADNIIVMRNGQIVEQGTHTELLAKDGSYADLIRLQNLSVHRDEDNYSNQSLTSTDITAEDSPNKLSDEYASTLDEKFNVNETVKAKEQPVDPVTDEDDADLGRKRPFGANVKGLWVFFRPYVLLLLLAFVAAIIVGGTYSACAAVFGNTLGELSPCKGESRIRWAGTFYGLMFFILAIVEFFANFASWSLFGFVAEKIVYKIRVLSFRALLEQDLQWHESNGRSPSMLLTLITKDGNALSGLTGSLIGSLVSVCVNFVTAVILTHIIAWKIALVFLAVVPLMLGAGTMRVIQMARFEQHHAEAFAKSIGITIEAVNSIKTVSSFSLEQEVYNTYRRSLHNPVKEITKHSAYASLWLAISYGLSNFLYALAYWWGAKQIITGQYSQTQFFIVLVALLVSSQLWGQMFTLAPDVSRAFTAISRILNLLDLGTDKKLSKSPGKHTDVEAPSGATEKLPSRGGISVAFDQVTFAYPARPDVQVLQGLGLSIQPGQFAALVGPSGAGKSTIISLVERMYRPSSGAIRIDNRDIAKYEGVSFRDNIALVSQDNVLFDGSIRFNVALGARPGHEPSDAEIEEACKIANIHDTITKLPEGYETYCGPNGSQLSGGQKQRLAIARALIRKPQLLLLDESTSALDAESEKLLQDGLEKAAQGITVIAIAHRLNTIQKADVIFLIEDGKCVDRGSHRELMERSESYRINALHQAVDGAELSTR